MTTVIGFENNVPGPSEPIDVRHVLFGRAVLLGRNVAMVKHDRGPTVFGFRTGRHGQQREDFQTLRLVRSHVPFVIPAARELPFYSDGTAGIRTLAQLWNGQWPIANVVAARGLSKAQARGECCNDQPEKNGSEIHARG